MSDEFKAVLSPAEEKFERIRSKLGMILAPIAFAAVWFGNFETLQGKESAHRLGAVMAGVVVLWLSEALPMPLTALLGATLCVVLQVGEAKEVFAPFADQLMFLFIGSFMLAQAIFLHGLDKRVAYSVLSLNWVGSSPSRILFAFGAVTAFISAWISNTATTAMMFAIGLSILQFLLRESAAGRTPRIDMRYATGMMLMTSFSASIGGLATPIGTPPNAIGLGMIRKQLEVDVSFFEWCLIGTPIVIGCFLFLWAYLNWLCPSGVKELTGSRELLAQRRQELGPWTTSQISTAVAFCVTVVLWVTPGITELALGDAHPAYKWMKASLPEAVPALLGAALLFLLPGDRDGRAITWKEAAEIDWGIVLLYGGGFAFGVLAQKTGLSDAIGRTLITLLPTGDSSLGLLIAATIVGTLVSEATSNTASANIVVPVVIAMAQQAGIAPLEPALGATFGCSLGFMLPVSTPCNAIVYGSGYVPLTRMIRYGIILDVIGIIVIITTVHFLVPFIQ